MKVVIFGLMGLVALLGIGIFGMILADARKHPWVRCFVVTENAQVYAGRDGSGFREIKKKIHGTVYVVGSVGNYWKLSNGYFMNARDLTPLRSDEYPTEL